MPQVLVAVTEDAGKKPLRIIQVSDADYVSILATRPVQSLEEWIASLVQMDLEAIQSELLNG